MTQNPPKYPVGQAIKRLNGLGAKLRTLRQAKRASDDADPEASTLAISAAQQIVDELTEKLKSLEATSLKEIR